MSCSLYRLPPFPDLSSLTLVFTGPWVRSLSGGLLCTGRWLLAGFAPCRDLGVWFLQAAKSFSVFQNFIALPHLLSLWVTEVAFREEAGPGEPVLLTSPPWGALPAPPTPPFYRALSPFIFPEVQCEMGRKWRFRNHLLADLGMFSVAKRKPTEWQSWSQRGLEMAGGQRKYA